MPAPVVASYEKVEATAAATGTLKVPTGTQAGDLLIGLALALTSINLDPLAGWHTLHSFSIPDSASQARMHVVGRIATAADVPGNTYSIVRASAGTNNWVVYTLRITGAHATAPLHRTASVTNSGSSAIPANTPVDSPSLDVDVVDALLVHWHSADSNTAQAAVPSTPSGTTSVVAENGNGNVSHTSIATEDLSDFTGLTTARSSQMTAPAYWGAVTLAITPDEPPPVAAVAGTPAHTASTTASMDAALPSGIVAGELLLAQVTIDTNVPTVNSFPGWTLVNSYRLIADVGEELWMRVADGTEGATVAVGLSAVANWQTSIVRVSGVDTDVPLPSITGALSSGTSIIATMPGSVRPNSLFMQFISSDRAAASTVAPPASLNEVYDRQDATFNLSALGVEGVALMGNPGTRTWTATATDSYSWIAVAVAPEPVDNTQTLSTPLLTVAPEFFAPTVTDYEGNDPGEVEDPITGAVYINGETVRSVNEVRLFIEHANTGNLLVTLKPPDGAPEVTLFDHRGSGANIGVSAAQPLILRDDAAQTLAAAFTSGTAGQTLQPEQPLATFKNEAGGTWTITVTDTVTSQSVVLPYARVESSGPKNQKKVLKPRLVRYDPTLYPPSVSPTAGQQTLTVPLLTVAPQLLAPAVTAYGAPQTLTTPLLSIAPAFFAPRVVIWQPLAPPLLNVAPQFFPPAVTPREVVVTVPLLAVEPELLPPAVGQRLVVPLLDVQPALAAPAVLVGGVALSTPLLDAEPVLWAPVVRQRIVLPRLTVAPALFAPEVLRQFPGTRPGMIGTRPGYGGQVRTGYIEPSPPGKVR